LEDAGPSSWLDSLLADPPQPAASSEGAGLRWPAWRARADEATDSRHLTPSGLERPRLQARVRSDWLEVCQGGLLLRTVLLVHGVFGLGMALGSPGLADWLFNLSFATLGLLPATLAWLAGLCAARQIWGLWPAWAQWGGVGAWGAACALAGQGLLMLFSRRLGDDAGAALPTLAWLAVGLIGTLLATVVLYWLHLRQRLRLPAATQARLAELQSRIRPHFLFNALNSAIALVRVDPHRAEEVLEDLSELFRAALADAGEQVSLGEEIELARRYLAIEQVRFGDRLRVSWDLDPDAGSAKLPSLLLQPLVENAVRHGVEPSDTGADVEISTERRRSSVVIKVTNTAPGGQGEPGHGVALDNVRARLHLLHDVHGRFNATFSNGVFQVRMELPVGEGIR
jgi:two-component system sensor histidine kinase AlgZ